MEAAQHRQLVVVADDFGIGPATTAGILELARRGVVTGTVLLVNSPHAAAAVRAWRQQGTPLELGWHPNLTLDAPVLPAGRVPDLVDADGRFRPLGAFLGRWLLGRLPAPQVEAELAAQLERYRDLVGEWPRLVNTHQHVGLFPPVGEALLRVLHRAGCRPYVRRVCEPLPLLWRIRGARLKRAVLSHLGRSLARLQAALGFPGNDWLAGITDPPWVRDPAFFTRWLAALPGRRVELVCHPGRRDTTLIGRDCGADDGLVQRRVDELALLARDDFPVAVRAAGFTLTAPSHLAERSDSHARAA